MKLLVTGRTNLALDLPPEVRVETFRESRPIPAEHLDADAVVAWGDPASIASMASDMPNLRWVQSLSAGTDLFESAGLGDDVVLTSGRGLHDATVTEHTVALILSLVRQLPQMFAVQAEPRWGTEFRGPRELQPPERVASILESRVLVWGFGSIGQHLAGVLTALGATVRGVARSAGERGGYPVVAEEDLDAELRETDILVMVLPSTDSTTKALDAHRLAQLPSRSIVVNVGRGSTVDEDALVDALEEGSIAGAAVDVASSEPLPSDARLWTAPNIVITPHVAGFRAYGGEQLVADNVAALLAGRPGGMRNVVERD